MEELLLERKKLENQMSDIATKIDEIDDKISVLESGNNMARYVIFPVRDHGAFDFYTRQENARWNIGELKIADDKIDFENCDPKIRRFIKYNMGITLALDSIIAKNIKTNFINEAISEEETLYLNSQENMEKIHELTYNLIIYTFLGEKECINFVNEMANLPEMSAVIRFVKKWTNRNLPLYIRYCAFAFIEGVIFCPFFSGIFYLKSYGKFKNLIVANEFISKDESIHRDFNIYKFLSLIREQNVDKNTLMEQVYEICDDCINLQDKLIDITYGEGIDDLTPHSVKNYSRFIADILLYDLGYPVKFNCENPFTWMTISNQVKTNFYDSDVSQYKTNFSETINKCLNNNSKDIKKLMTEDFDI